MFGAYTFGEPYFGQSPTYTTLPDTRGDCGGIFGTVTFGQSYFGGHIQCPMPAPPTPDTRPDCGGIFGTATFGQSYFGGHIQCPMPIPPTPPAPSAGPSAIGSGHAARGRHHLTPDEIKRLQSENAQDAENAMREQIQRIEESDAEDIMLIISLWMNLK